MKILNGIISSNIIKFKQNKAFKSSNDVQNYAVDTAYSYVTGNSRINPNLPVSYKKISEIDIPGLDNKACVYRLANGQRVVIAPKKGPVYIKTTYNTGSMNETDNIRGISHFIEHNLFNGSKELMPREYDKKVSGLGAYTNASTGFSRTDYFIRLQLFKDNSLEEAIKLNAMQTQFPTFPAEQLEKEKEPVKSEIDMDESSPERMIVDEALKNLFGIKSDSKDLIAGSKDNVNSFTRDMLIDYYNTWYTPDNAVTVITGDVDVDETINLVAKYYNKTNDYSNVQKRHTENFNPVNMPVRKDIIPENASTSSVCMAFAVPEGIGKIESDRINILLNLLMAPNSHLSKALDDFGISINFSVENLQNKPDGTKAILVEFSSPEERVEDIIKTIYEELSFISNNPPSSEELENIKNSIIHSVNSTFEKSEKLNSVLTDMVLDNNINYFSDTLKNIRTVQPSDLSDTAKTFFNLNKVSICVAHDKTSTSESIISQYNKSSVSKQVSFGALHNPIENINKEISQIKQYQLPNNIETMIIPASNSQKSVISVNFDNDNLNNVSSAGFLVLNEILNRGSRFKDKNTVDSIMAAKDIDVQLYSSDNGMVATVICYNENFNDAIGLLKEKILYPDFSIQEFERAKQIIKDTIINSDVSAEDKLMETLFPSLRKYKSKEQILQELDLLTIQDIQTIYINMLTSSQACASLTADVSNNPNLQNIFHSEFASGFPVFKPFIKDKSCITGHNIYVPNNTAKTVTDVKEQPQAEIIRAYTYKNPENIEDIAKIQLLNNILGGSMSSRLFSDLREDKKLAYHVSSNIYGEKDTGVLEMYIKTTTESPDDKEGSLENVTKAIEGFDRNVNNFRTVLVSEKELEDAKTRLKTEIINDMETDISKTALYNVSKSTQYDKQYIAMLLEAIDKTTVQDIQAAANYVFKNYPVTSVVASKHTLDYFLQQNKTKLN